MSLYSVISKFYPKEFKEMERLANTLLALNVIEKSGRYFEFFVQDREKLELALIKLKGKPELRPHPLKSFKFDNDLEAVVSNSWMNIVTKSKSGLRITNKVIAEIKRENRGKVGLKFKFDFPKETAFTGEGWSVWSDAVKFRPEDLGFKVIAELKSSNIDTGLMLCSYDNIPFLLSEGDDYPDGSEYLVETFALSGLSTFLNDLRLA